MCGNCQQRSYLWRWKLLLFFLWSCSGTEARHHLACLPLSVSTPQPVLGFWELLRKGTGCSSQERSATGQEVHIVSLSSGIPANGQITLVVAPDPKDGAPVFMLYSQVPVLWMLPSPPGKNWTFQVSLGSSVSASEPGVFTKETNFPETLRGLLKWARREHGGITSLAEYHGVNTVYIHLGADETAPATCKLHRNFFTSLHFASERQLQPLQICLNSYPSQDLEVHIIFCKGLAPSMLSSRPSLAHLTVELHDVRRSPRQALLLILKSEGAAQWRVQAHRFTGQLHVLASHKVIVSSTEADLPLIVTQHTSPGLAYIRDPLKYAAKQKLPAFTSYTEAERVNRFLLVVGMNEATPTIPVDPKLFGPLFLPPPKLLVKRQQFPEAITTSWTIRPEISEEDSSVIHLLPTSKTEGLESTLCPTGEQKPLQEKQGFQRVSRASSSSTQTSPQEATMAFQDLPFHHGNVLLSLEVYSSDSFANQPGPCAVSANSWVFVEASLASYDLCLGFTIQRCFISPSSDPLVASSYLLVQHGCAVDAHVNMSELEQATQGQALPPGYQERQRLSFLLQPRFNDSIQFLHCHLVLCSRDPQDPSKPKGPIPKCPSENEACKGEVELARNHFQRTVTKPIIVTVEAPLRAAIPGLRTDNFPPSHQGKALKDPLHSWKTQPVPTAAAPGLELPAVFGIAFSAFIIGVSLTGGLWFIHSQTGEATIRNRSRPTAERDSQLCFACDQAFVPANLCSPVPKPPTYEDVNLTSVFKPVLSMLHKLTFTLSFSLNE
ncbi:transforming growth factor beta receptor type 3-like isoform X2 [Sceloporus undulatus]|uniref:transforming growth factor beta receptor type 3-like isoform X2 n=1 Tax=Sceloporus undulatus TaxID=8520 RepID=UPI001C4AA74D|nr:transforming growth factor beta receptor type 3-like isoform X2 [Sceloporus undulatus]